VSAPPRAPARPGWASRRSRSSRAPALLLLPSIAAALLALLPLSYLAVRATEQGWDRVAEIVLRERTAELMVRSGTLAVVVTAACVVIGVLLAWLVVRSDLPGRRVWGVLAALPLAVPTYVAAYAWISTAPELAGFRGAALVLTLCSYPYVYLPVAAALRGLDPALEESSRSLGTRPLLTFARVTLPQLRPAIGAGGLLVALYVLSDFGAVSIMRHDVFTRVIYTSYRASFDRTPAAVLGCLLVLVTLVLVWLESRTRGRARYARLGSGARRRLVATRLGPWTVPGFAVMAAVSGLALGLPLASLAFWLARGRSGFALADVSRAAWASLWVSGLGALVTTLLAVPVGVLAARYRSRLASAIERSSYAGHALPGVVVALAMVFVSVRYAVPLYQRTPTLVAAYAVLFLPLAVGAVRASVAQAPPVLEEVARSLGQRQRDVLRRVTLPLAAPGIGAGAALVFLTCMKELPATLLLRPTGMDTLATELWSETGVGAYAAAAPYAALLVLLAAIPTYLLGRHTGALEGGGEQ
jgi:iron(III) transport system permease protein